MAFSHEQKRNTLCQHVSSEIHEKIIFQTDGPVLQAEPAHVQHECRVEK